jgi:asparagine synthase (glutamine-hydrolysing)
MPHKRAAHVILHSRTVSGIAGIFHLDSSPIDAYTLQRMTDAIAHRGKDGASTWVDGSVGLGHRMLRTTPEALHERQPLLDESGLVCLVLDGRVDNREELCQTLADEGAALRDDTDAELVLKSYLQWGEDAPIRILGDFAFAIWDGRLGALFCARDIFGIRPLNYYRGGNFVLIASELHQLFHDSRVKRVPNEGMVAEYLSAQITHCGETLWEGILRLPPAHFMWVKPGSIEKRRYWDFDLSKKVRYKNDEEYAAQFLDLFREAVRCRLRSCGPIGSYLSGGLDSSSVSVIANELLREQGRAEPLDTFSLVFPGMICDESEYIQATVQHAGLRSHLFPPIPSSVDYYREIASHYQDFPGWPNGGAMMTLPLQEGLREAGTRVMLSGWGGNECVEGMDNDLAVLSSEGRLLELVSKARSQAADGGPSWWRLAFDYGVRPHIPRTVKRGLRALLRRKRSFECLPLEFQHRTALLRRVDASAYPAGASPVQQVMYSCFYSGWATLFHEISDREGGFLGVELRHPFFDRRLAEFSFAIPEHQRSQSGLTKIVLRNALQGRLPESVIGRRIQSEFTPMVKKAFDTTDFRGLLSSAAIGERGWIIPSEQISCIERFRAGESLNVWKLWAAIGMEIWCCCTQNPDATD